MAKTVKVQLNGKEVTMAYPLLSVIRLEKEQGVRLQDLSDKEKANDIENILKVLWAGFIHENKDLTVEELGNMIDLTDLPELTSHFSVIFEDMQKKN